MSPSGLAYNNEAGQAWCQSMSLMCAVTDTAEVFSDQCHEIAKTV